MRLTADSTHYRVLAALAPDSTSYLEIGVQEGGSLRTVLTANPTIRRLLLCDTWDDRHGGTNRGSADHIADLLADRDATVLSGRSQSTLPAYLSTHDRVPPFDLVHVDGGHDETEVRQDLSNVWPLTRHHLVLHDTSFPQVWRVLGEFAREVVKGDGEVDCVFGDEGTAIVKRTNVRRDNTP